MRLTALFFAAFVFHITAYCQNSTVGMTDEFREMSKFGSKQSGFEGLQTYSSGTVTGCQFFYPTWATGTITTITNETFGKNYLFLYDKVRQELFMKWKDSSFVLLADKARINSFTINTDRAHSFSASSAYGTSGKGDFFEVLVNDTKGYSLLKLTKTKFVKANPGDIEKQRLGEIYDAFEDEVTYYVSYKMTIPQSIALKEKNIKKVLGQDKNKVDGYFDQHPNSETDESFLTGLVQSLN